MDSIRKRPLVSMAMTTYNRKEYIREALAGLFAQTYDPLEIVISDDCSTDGTWEIINEEVTKYRAEGGRHMVFLHRNEQNLKVLRNFEKLVSLCHGDLIVQCGDDDISLANRAEYVVNAWMKDGGRATVICHAWDRMDIRGESMGKDGPWPVTQPLGAAICYKLDAIRHFSPVSVLGGFEDHVFTFRALCFGKALMANACLVRYRLGSGMTSGSGFIKNRLSVSQGSLLAAEQSKLDFAEVRGKLAFDKIVELESFLEFEQSHYGAEDDLLSGKTFAERWDGFKRMNVENSWNLNFVMRFCYYFPCVLSFNLARSIHYLLLKRRQLKNRLRK